MKKTFTILIAAIAAILMMAQPMKVWADNNPDVTYDFTGSDWTVSNGTLSNGTVSFTGAAGNASGSSFKMNSGYFIMGKSGAYLNFPNYSNAVSKIVITGRSGASASVKQNIYVSGTAVSTETTGATGTNTYEIATANQAAGTTYTLKVTSAHSTQITKIEIYYASGAGTTPSITADNVDILYTATGGSIAYTLDDQGTTGAVTASVSSGNDWLSKGEGNNSPISVSCAANPLCCARKATVRLTYTYNNGTQSVYKDVVVTQAANTTTGATGSDADHPFTVAQARAAIDYNENVAGVYATGIVCTASSNLYSGKYLSYWISADGDANSDKLEAYNGLGLDGEYFTNVNDVQVGATVVIYGDLTKYNSTYEFATGNYLVSYTAPVAPTITVDKNSLSGFTYEEGHGPSTTKTISVSGSNLSEDITLTLAQGDDSAYELSLLENSDFSNSLTLNQSNGNVTATTVYVRMKANLSVGNYNTGYITVASTGATSVTVNLTGTVTEPEVPNVTWNLSTASYDEITDPDIVTWSSIYATMTNSSKTGGTTASNYLGGDSNNRTSTRFYENNTLTISPAIGYNISSVVFTATSNGYASALKNSNWTYATASMESGSDVKVVTVTPTQGHESEAISATIGGTCGFTEVKVYYTANSTPTCTITFNGNGGTVGEAITYTQTVYSGTATALNPNQFTNTNGEFSGWNTESNGSGDDYDNGESITITADLTLYAQWAQSHTATVEADIAHGTVYIVGGTGDPNSLTAVTGTPVTLTNTPDSGYEFSSWNVYKDGDPNTTVKVTDDKFNMPDYDVIVSATFTTYVGATYTRVTTIENGRHYIIVGIDESNTNKGAFAMSNDKGNNRNAAAVNITTDENGTYAQALSANVYEFVINGPDADGRYTIYDANWKSTYGGYLYASSSSDNRLMTRQFNVDANSMWGIAFDNDAYATITAQGTNSRNLMRFNPGAANSDPLFNGYATTSNTGSLPYLFVKDEVTPQYDFYMDIAAHTDATGAGNTDGWNFIALPVSGTYTLLDSYMVAGTYDLYRLNNITWENYKNNEHADFTTLNNGTGYLYANSANTTLHFSGAINEFTTDGNANVKNLSDGWNLIGNPYNIPIYINKPYYRMNADGTAVETEDGITSIAIPACTGVVIKASANESVTFSTSAPTLSNGNHGNIQMSVIKNNVRGNDVQDKAIVSFNEGSKLEKFQLFEGNAKLYIPQNGEDYAIAFSNRQGDMPLNFKTTEAGMYTISFEGDNMDLKGVCLIDMLAEEKIDLSVDPSYTFIGSPADKAERFKIVFSPSTGSGADIFAYQSGSDIIVSGEGELQIFDVMGRKVKTQYVSGVQTVNVNAQGVYIMKLNEKTQKIIVR